MFKDLTKNEVKLLKKLSNPYKIQDWLNSIPQNFDETLLSPRRVMKYKKAHCIEGAIFAALALAYHGEKPLILDLRASSKDFDHVVALYKIDGFWGAISKTNYPVLRFREPVYKSVRELVMSYFHEYAISKNGVKTLRDYSKPFDLSKVDPAWVTDEEELWDLAIALDESPHIKILSKKQIQKLRKLSEIERRSSEMTEWAKPKKKK
ncbi:hypothetical protein IPJ63_02610 [Candidatus Nomurabacteria bacterium]|nr:MAG: hypothetical protein IPJ63_02610 [Candidatus Nomurabacteria bacterium]